MMKAAISSALLLVCSLVAGINLVGAAETPAPGKIRVLVTYGGHGFETKPFWAMFDALPNVAYTKAEMPKAADLLKPGFEKQYDVVVMYDMAPRFTPEQQKAFVELLKTGIGLVSLHHNLGAHGDWEEFANIIGGAYLHKARQLGGKTYGPSVYAEGQDIKVSVADRRHPITAGVDDFQIHDECYGKFYTAPDVKVLLTTDHPKNEPPVAWVKQYGKSRVFHFMLGHGAVSWKNPAYPRILANGIRWAAGK